MMNKDVEKARGQWQELMPDPQQSIIAELVAALEAVLPMLRVGFFRERTHGRSQVPFPSHIERVAVQARAALARARKEE